MGRAEILVALLLLVTGCPSRRVPDDGEPRHVPSTGTPSPSASTGGPTASPSAGRPSRITDIPASVDALAASSTVLYAVSKERGLVFAVPLELHDAAAATVLSSSEREPFAIVVRRNKPIWATADGVFTTDESPSGRRALVHGEPIHALAAGPDAVYYGTSDAIWRMDGSGAAPAKIADAHVDEELIAIERSLAWRDRRELSAVDLR
jgi:hypothetical protein